MTVQLAPLPEFYGLDEDEIICPWCKATYSHEFTRWPYSETQFECQDCGKLFVFVNRQATDGELDICTRGVRSDTDLRYMEVMGLTEPERGTLL